MHWDSRGGHQVLVLAVDIEVSFILFGSRVRIVNPAIFLTPSHRGLWVLRACPVHVSLYKGCTCDRNSGSGDVLLIPSSRALLRGDLPFTILKASLPGVSPRWFVGRLIAQGGLIPTYGDFFLCRSGCAVQPDVGNLTKLRTIICRQS